jgi:chromosome segregation ATPase
LFIERVYFTYGHLTNEEAFFERIDGINQEATFGTYHLTRMNQQLNIFAKENQLLKRCVAYFLIKFGSSIPITGLEELIVMITKETGGAKDYYKNLYEVTRDRALLLQHELDECTKRLKKTTTTNPIVIERVKRVSNDKEIQEWKQKSEEYKKQIDDLLSQRVLLQEELDKEKKMTNKYTSKCDLLQEQYQALHEQYGSLEQDYKALQEELALVKQQLREEKKTKQSPPCDAPRSDIPSKSIVGKKQYQMVQEQVKTLTLELQQLQERHKQECEEKVKQALMKQFLDMNNGMNTIITRYEKLANWQDLKPTIESLWVYFKGLAHNHQVLQQKYQQMEETLSK